MAYHLRLSMIPFLIILLGACAAVVNARDFWSIDCGGTEPFTDARNITWVDDALTAPPNGVPYSFPPNTLAYYSFGPTPLTRQLSTLRAFPSNTTKKHCYTVPDIGAGRKILVRTSFFYGNYDGKRKPPRFRLTFEADDLSAVFFEDNGNNYTVPVFEVIYTTRNNGTSVCLNRVYPGEDPFINSIEIRALPEEMYDAVGGLRQMSTMKRAVYGVNATIRYPDDAYDRLWNPVRTTPTQLYPSIPNTAPFVNVSSLTDAPPQLAFQNAAVPVGNAVVLNITTGISVSMPVLVYFNMYFTEPANLTGTGDVRAFHVFMDGAPLTNLSRPIVPRYGQAKELFGILLLSPGSVFSLVPANGSTLVPIVNAVEVFWIGDVLTNMTDVNDVRGLEQLQDQYPILREWTGDPCLPSAFAWEWVGCSFSNPPRITKLLLSGLGLSGGIPDFSSLDALLSIDLHDNKFTGTIPEYLAKLPNIKLLNLAGNNFTNIPQGLYQKNSSLMLNVTGNPALCGQNQYCVSSLNLDDVPPSQPPPPVSTPPPPPSRSGSDASRDGTLLWLTIVGFLIAFI